MKSGTPLMLKRLAVAVALASTFWISRPSIAQEQPKPAKPIAVVSVAPFERTLPDLDYFLGAINMPEIGGILNMATSTYTKGIDPSRPIGIVISVDLDDGDAEDAVPNMVVCVPLADAEEWFKALGSGGMEPEDLGDGLYEILTPMQYVYGKSADGWFYIAPSEDSLKDLPADPISLVGDLPSRYTFAVRVDLEQLSEEDRKRIFEEMQSQVQGNLAEQFGDQLPDGLEEADQGDVEQFNELLAQSQQIVLGFLIDPAEKKVLIDVAMQFVPGSKYALQFEGLSQLKSDLTAIKLPNSAADVRITSIFATQEEKEEAKKGIRASIEQLTQNSERVGLPSDRADLLKKLVENASKLIDQTIEEGIVDAALSASYNDDVLRAIAGVRVADGRAIENELKEFIAGFAETSEIEVESDYATHGGWSLHKVRAKVPASSEQAVALLGEQLELFVAGSEKFVLISIDPDGDQTLQATIDQLESTQSVEAAPVEATFHIGDVVRLLQKIAPESEDEEAAAQMLQSLMEAAERIGHDDAIKATTTVLPRGFVTRIAVEEGVLKTFGSAIKSGGLMPPGF